jgi:hypothetical protein
MARELKSTLQGLSHHGEGRRYNFAKYCTAHTEQHGNAEALMDHGYPGLSDDQKITYYLDGIKTSAFDVTKATIRATPGLKSDFYA